MLDRRHANAGLQGLAQTLFERVLAMHGRAASTMLTVQYRMHQTIMQWSSDELYGGALTAHRSVAEHSLSDLPVRRVCRSQAASAETATTASVSC